MPTSANSSTTTPPPATAPFGTVFAATMATAVHHDGAWQPAELGPVAPLSFHPATHAFHYGSTCFEGLKAHRGDDGLVRIFRMDAHVARMQRSAELLMLPVPDPDLLAGMIRDTVTANREEIPAPPGSLYLRPTLLGTDPNVGAAASPSGTAILFILASPVGDYFAGGIRPLRVAVEVRRPRTTPQFGMVKAGANYVMALRITQEAKKELGADQVLFAPGGAIQETGASNFLLLDDHTVVTRGLDESFLHGVTRDSVLVLARDLGYRIEERAITVEEMLEWARHGEAALSGTAAILSGVGTLIHEGVEHRMGSGDVGPNTRRLREALTSIQRGTAPDRHGWTLVV